MMIAGGSNHSKPSGKSADRYAANAYEAVSKV